MGGWEPDHRVGRLQSPVWYFLFFLKLRRTFGMICPTWSVVLFDRDIFTSARAPGLFVKLFLDPCVRGWKEARHAPRIEKPIGLITRTT